MNNHSPISSPPKSPRYREKSLINYRLAMQNSTDRRALRREQTRARLIHSARKLLAEHGFADVGIAEITDNANMGTGTFYNYFHSREELFTAVAEESVEILGATLDRDISRMPDAAEAFAGSLRHLVRYALNDRVWGGFLVQMGAAHPALMRILGPRARRDLLRGVESGRFTIDDLDLATTCTFGSLIAAIQLAMNSEEEGPADRDQLFATAMLRMVGVPAEEAHEVATRPLPDIHIAGADIYG